MDFKYKSRLGKTWDQTSLERTLARDFPGAKTLQDALEQARRSPRVIEAESIPEPAISHPERPKARLPYKDESDEIIDF